MLYYLWEYKNNVLLYVSVCICLHFFTYVLWSVHEIVKLLIHGHSEKLTHLINKNIFDMQIPGQTLMLNCPKSWHKNIRGHSTSKQDFLAQKRKFHEQFFCSGNNKKRLSNMPETFPLLQQHSEIFHQKQETRQLDKHGNYPDTGRKKIL